MDNISSHSSTQNSANCPYGCTRTTPNWFLNRSVAKPGFHPEIEPYKKVPICNRDSIVIKINKKLENFNILNEDKRKGFVESTLPVCGGTALIWALKNKKLSQNAIRNLAFLVNKKALPLDLLIPIFTAFLNQPETISDDFFKKYLAKGLRSVVDNSSILADTLFASQSAPDQIHTVKNLLKKNNVLYYSYVSNLSLFLDSLTQVQKIDLAKASLKSRNIDLFISFIKSSNTDLTQSDTDGNNIIHLLACVSNFWTPEELEPFWQYFREINLNFNQENNLKETPTVISYNRGYLENKYAHCSFWEKAKSEKLQGFHLEHTLEGCVNLAHTFSIEKVNTSSLCLRGNSQPVQRSRLIESVKKSFNKYTAAPFHLIRKHTLEALQKTNRTAIFSKKLSAGGVWGIIPVYTYERKRSHAIEFIGDDSYVAYCNRGYGGYNIPGKKRCRSITIVARSEFEAKIDQIRKALHSKKIHDIHRILTPIHSIETAFQKIGNCTKASAKLGLKAYLFFKAAKHQRINFRTITQQQNQTLLSITHRSYKPATLEDRLNDLLEYDSVQYYCPELYFKCMMKALHTAYKRLLPSEIEFLIKSGNLYSYEHCLKQFNQNPSWDLKTFVQEHNNYFCGMTQDLKDRYC